MSDSRRLFRPVISVVLLSATALGLINVFSDNAAVVALAKQTACGHSTCKAQTTKMSRNPIAQDFTFATRLKHAGTVRVSCHRAYYLLGAYQCSRSVE